MIIGAHLRNEARVTDDDANRFRLARFDGALVPWYVGARAHVKLGVDPARCIVRLPDSEYTRWPQGTKYIPSYQDYAKDCAETVALFYEEGYRLFQLDNEPNLTWPAHGYTAWDWAWFAEHALPIIKSTLAVEHDIHDAQIGFTPLAMPQQHTDWWNITRVLREQCDFVTAHCYWQYERYMASDSFGRGYNWISDQMSAHGEPHKPIYVTECGNSIIQSPQPPPLDRIEAEQAQEYPQYIKQCLDDSSLISGIFFFILGHNGSWAGFELTEPVCTAIGTRLAGSGGGGGPNTPKAV